MQEMTLMSMAALVLTVTIMVTAMMIVMMIMNMTTISHNHFIMLKSLAAVAIPLVGERTIEPTMQQSPGHSFAVMTEQLEGKPKLILLARLLARQSC